MNFTPQTLAKKIIPILQANNVEFAGVFGSVARGEASNKSDVDLLVRFGNRLIGLFRFVGLERELSEALNHKVDLVSEKYLHRLIKDNVARDLKVIYGQRRYI